MTSDDQVDEIRALRAEVASLSEDKRDRDAKLAEYVIRRHRDCDARGDADCDADCLPDQVRAPARGFEASC